MEGWHRRKRRTSSVTQSKGVRSAKFYTTLYDTENISSACRKFNDNTPIFPGSPLHYCLAYLKLNTDCWEYTQNAQLVHVWGQLATSSKLVSWRGGDETQRL